MRKRVEYADIALNGGSGVPFGLALESGPLPGDERRYQVWYRDPSGPCGSGFNLSNGFAVTYTP